MRIRAESTISYVVLLLGLTLTACMPTFARGQEKPQEMGCISQSCVPLAELEGVVGFRPAQPSYIPPRFGLFAQSKSTFEPAESLPTSAVMEYRLLGSPFVPAIQVIEMVVRGAESIALAFDSPGCGSTSRIEGRTLLYGEGAGGFYSSGDLSTWNLCIGEGPTPIAAYSVYFVEGSIITEVKAFKESGLTLQEVLKIASSIRFDRNK